MYNEEDRKWLYDRMKQANVDTGTYDEFKTSLNNKEDRDWYYDKSQELGLDVGSSSDFESMMTEAATPSQHSGQGENYGNDDGFSQVPSQPTQSEESVPKLSAEDVQFLPSGGFGAASVLSPQTGESARNPSPNPSVEGNDGMSALDEQFAQYVQDGDRSRTPYDKMVVDLLGSGTAETPNDAVNMAYNLTSRYADRTSRQLAGEVISGMDADKSDMGASINEAWYRRDVQDAIVQRARELGLSYQAYVRDHLKPAVQKELSRRYGYSDETAKTWANWIYQDYDAAQNQMHQQEAMQMVQPYVQSFVDEAFGKVDAEARDMWQDINDNTTTMYTPQGVPTTVGLSIYGQMKEQQITDPQRVWDELLEPNIKTMVMKMSGDQQFWDGLTSKAEEEGMDAARYAEYRIAPVIEAMVYDQWLKTGVAREMPENVVEYVMGKMKESLPGMVINSMMNSKTRRRMQQEAMARTEEGDNKRYAPGYVAKVVGGAAPMVVELPLFTAAGSVTRGISTNIARNILGKETFETLGERILAGSVGGSMTFGTVDAVKGGLGGALDSDSDNVAGVLGDVLKGAYERGKGGLMTGAAFVGGPVGQAIGNGRGVFANLLGWGASVGINASAATAMDTGSRLLADGSVDIEHLPDTFFENVGTFLALELNHKIPEIYGIGKGGRNWNGVRFDKDEVSRLSDVEGAESLREVFRSIEKEKQSGKIASLLRARADIPGGRRARSGKVLTADQVAAVEAAGAKYYDSVMVSPDILLGTKVKLSQALQLPLPDEVTAPAEYFDNIRKDGSRYVLTSRNRYGMATGEEVFDKESDAVRVRDEVEAAWMNDARERSSRMEYAVATERVYGDITERINDEYLTDGGVANKVQRRAVLQAKADLHEKDKNAPSLSAEERAELESLELSEHEMNLNWLFAHNAAYDAIVGKHDRGEPLTAAEQQVLDEFNAHVRAVANDYVGGEIEAMRREFGVDSDDVDSLRDYIDYLEENPTPNPSEEGNETSGKPTPDPSVEGNESARKPTPDPSVEGNEGKTRDVDYSKVTGDDGIVREVTLGNGKKVYVVRSVREDESSMGVPVRVDTLEEFNNDAGAFTAYDIDGNVAGRFRKDAIVEMKEIDPKAEKAEAEKGVAPSSHQSETMTGRSMTAEETQTQLQDMKEKSVEAPVLELTPENWYSEFGEDGMVSTPIGDVKMGDNQYLKLAQQGRNGKLGMVKPTLVSPDVIIEDERPSKDGNEERPTSYVFVKTFSNPDGSRYYHFTSVTVSKEGKEVVVSNQEKSENRISRLLQTGKVAWIDSKFSPHPKARVGESVPVSETNRPTSTDNQSALLGIDSPELSGGKDSEKLSNAQGNGKNLKEKDGDNVNGAGRKVWYDGVEYSEGSVPARVTVSKAVVDKAVGKEYETVGSNGSRVVLKVLGYDAYGNVRVERTDYGKDGSREMSEQTFLTSRISDALSKKALVPVRSLDERLRAAAGRSLHAQRLIDTLDDAEKEGLLDLIEASRRRGDAGRQDVEERLAELRESHFEDLMENTRSSRQNDVEKALGASGGYSERLRRLRKIYSPYEEASALLDDAVMEPVTIEEYAASFLGDVPKAGHGFIDHESLQQETGHGRRRIGGDSRGYGAYLARKGEGKSINRLAHEMWESLPEILKDVRSDADCKNALLDVIGGAERPTDIANYVLRARMEAAEAAVRHEEEMELEEHEAGRLSLKMDEMYERYVKEQGTVDAEGGLVLDAASQRSLSSHWAGALHALGRRIGRRIVVLSEEDAKSRFGDNADKVNGIYEEGTLYLNEMVIDDEGLRSFVAGHELTHVLKTESPEVWQSYVDAVKAAMGDYYDKEFARVRDEYDNFYDEYNDLHPESPLKKLSDREIEEEVCANWAGDHILTDEASIRRIVESAEAAGADPVALTSRILDWIKETLGGLRSAFGRGEDVVDEIDAMERARKLWQGMYNVAAARKNAKLKPVGKGDFGNIYDQFKGKPKEAVDFLLENKSGDLLGVFHRDGFGDIDLAWGNKDDNAGLEHIISKHVGRNKDFADTDELSQTMDDVIKNGDVIREKWDKAIFEKDGKRVVVRKNLRDKEGNIIEENKNWVVTSYDKEVPLKKKQDSASTLATPESGKGGRAVTSKSVSEGKDSENASKLQEKVEKNAVQGIDGYDADEVMNAVRGDIEMRLEDAGLDSVSIKGMALHGSRMRGDAREDSDLDVVVEYEGDISEDGLFNILNEDPIEIEGITVDVNPITKGKSGTLEEYMKRSRKYDEEVKDERLKVKDERGKDLKVEKDFKERLATAIEETNTEPTDDQKEAGNYRKGHLQFGGYNFTVENPKGSVRSGKDASGKAWSVRMHNTYGYLTGKGHLGKDGDHLDVFINDDADLDLFGNNGNNGKIYIIDQVNADGSFDEHKIMWGFANEVDAIRNYLLNYSRPWHGLGNITGVDKATFDKWVASSGRKVKPFAETRFGDSRDVVSKVLDAATLSRQSGEEGNNQAPKFSLFDNNEKPSEEKTKVIFDTAKKKFGTTYDIREAGYVLPDGTMLDFSGRHELFGVDDSGISGRRTSDHREISSISYVYDKDGNEVETGVETSMPDFIERGAIRIDNNAGTINLIVKPTKEQRDVLARLIRNNGGDVTVDFGNGWDTDHSVEYYESKYPRILNDISRYFDEGIKPEGNQPRFSVSGAPFYSNAEKAVDGIKQEKATPEQWLKMIEKNGGLKAGEDKWIGLSEWLKGQDKKSLTKQEVLDFIRENQIQIEETNYQEGVDVDGNPQMKEFRTEFDDIVKKLEDEKEAVEQEANAFNDEMYQKYGEGWANDPDRLSEEDQRRNDEMIERWQKLNDEDIREFAFREMVEKYGDDFGMAFEYNPGNGRIEPQMDMYGDNISDAAKYFLQLEEQPINSTRLSYTTEGLDNKKEIALTVPTVESWNESDEVHFGDAGEGRAVAWVRFGETEGIPNGIDADRYHDYSRKMKEAISRRNEMVEKLKRYKGGMLTETQKRLEEEEAYIQQLRKRYKDVADVKPTRVLVIDEIQSKRHQEGREKGYKQNYIVKGSVGNYERITDKLAYADVTNENGIMIGQIMRQNGKYIALDQRRQRIDFNRYDTESEALAKIEENAGIDPDSTHIPDAPFDKNWHELAMKRMLRYAAENGYDKIAWTKGEQQAERYNIGNKVDRIISYDYPETADPDGRKSKKVEIRLKDNETMTMRVNADGTIIEGRWDTEGKNLSDVVGKDLAKRIMNGEGIDGTIYDANKDLPAKIISGDGLRIGGEGMKGFYDQMLPRFMDKYGKKWGVKTGEVELPNVEEAGRKMWSVDVTPEMKESVMQGQPMFALGDHTRTFKERQRGRGGVVSLKPEARRAGKWVEGDLFGGAAVEGDLFDTEARRGALAKVVSMRPVKSRLDDNGLSGDYPYLQSFKKDHPDALAAQDDGDGGMVFRGNDALAVENITGLSGSTVKGVRELHIPSMNVDRYLPMLVRRGKSIAVIDPDNVPSGKSVVKGVSAPSESEVSSAGLRQLLESKANRDADFLRSLIRHQESYIKQLQAIIPAEERLYDKWQRSIGTKDEESAQRAYEKYYSRHEDTILAYDEARNQLEDLHKELSDKLRSTVEKKERRLSEMSDAELLEEIGKEEPTDRYIEDVSRQDCMEEYDLRHKEDYGSEVDAYMKMLEDSGTDLDDAYGMYSSVSAQWHKGGYRSEERTKLRAQIDALEDYIERKEAEAYEIEIEAEREAAAAKYAEEKEQVRNQGYNLTGLKMRDLDEGETSHVERRYVENGFFSFTSGERVESAGDVAFMFRELENAAVENSFMVLVKDGVPTVVHLAIGDYANTFAPVEQAFVAAKAIDPDSVVFVHNHPSGALKASRADLNIQTKVETIFGSKARPGIIIDTTSGKYAEYTGSPQGHTEWQGTRPESVEREVPVKVYNFSKQVFSKDWDPNEAFQIVDSRNVAAFVSSHRLGEHPKMSMIVLNNQNKVTGNIFLPWTNLKDAAKGESVMQMATYVNQMGGNGVVLYGNFAMGEDGRLLRGLSTNLKGLNVRLVDAMNINSKSAYDSGVMEEGAQYGERAATASQQSGQKGDVVAEADALSGMDEGFARFAVSRRPTNHQRNAAAERRMEERRLAQAKAAALDAGVREPLREDYEARAHREWLAAHRAWEQAPDASAEPNEWDFEHRMQQEYDRARREYEEKLQQYMPPRSDELTAADVIEERERMVHTPAQRQTNKIVDVMASERDPLSAMDTVKDTVIQRRKNIEEVSANDSVYINDIRRETDKLAMKLNGQKEKEDQVTTLIRGMRRRLGIDSREEMITGKDIRDALPYIIEADMRRRDIANDACSELQGKGSPVRLSAEDIRNAEERINEMRGDAALLLAVQRQMEEEGRITMSSDERALRDKVYKEARSVAMSMNASRGDVNRGREVTADDIMAVLSIVTKRVMPEGMKLMEYTDHQAWPEVQGVLNSIKDWYAQTYGWLEDAGLRKEGIGYYKDYVNHVWDRKQSDPEAWERYVANRQPTTSKNMRKREIRTLMDGIDAGLVPKYNDIADLMGDYSKSNTLAWANRKMLRDLSFIDIVERGDDGEVKAMVPMLSTKAPNAFEIGKYDYYEIPGIGTLWVHKAVSKNFRLVFETYEAGKGMARYDKAASIAKNIELAWSGFHAAALSEVYLAQNVMRHPVKMARNFWRYMVKDALLQGQPPAYTDPELYEDAARHLVKLGATGDYAPEALKDLSSSIKDSLTRVRRELQSRGAMGKAAGVVVGIPEVVTAAIKMVNNGMDKALWTWLHDGLKLCQYKMFREDVLSQAEREGWADERIDKALDEAGQYINDEFGGQHFEVISVSPKMLRMMRRFLLSPDWLLSTQRHFLANFGFGSIYNKANMRSFMDFYKNVWKRGKGNEGQFDGRYSRAKASIVCYGLGCMIMYPLMMNALNALMRKKDEEYELQKERENEGYVSKYRLAYPDGMKGFEMDNLSLDPFESFNIFGDYGMGGNAEGKKSHLFFGRYSDDTEMYIRWGKQFREFPELFENEKGEAAFPSPLLKRLMGKSNPNIRFLYDTLNYYTRWDKSKNDEDLEDKWREWIGDGKLQRNFGIPMGVGAEKLLMNYLPFWAPTQRDKEWKPTDMILPSTKGFTAYKARNYFTQFIKVNDEEGIKETFKAAVLNGMNTAAITRAWESARKAVENESRDMRLKNGNEIQSVVEAFDLSADLQERKELNSRIRKMLAADAEPPQDWDEFLTQVRAERDGDTEGATKASEKYLMVATSEDILEDARLAQLKKKASEMKRIHDGMKDNKADADLIRRWEQENQKWLDVLKIIKDGESGSDEKRGTLYWKKKMSGDAKKDGASLERLRKKRKEVLAAAGERLR